MRAFIAAELPAAVRGVLAEIQDALRAHGLSLKWVRPEGIHLTVRFLGDSTPESIDRLKEALAPAIAAGSPPTLWLEGGGVFPPNGPPRVLWTGVAGDTDRLVELGRRVEQVVVACGWPAEKRPFHPHLTLARVAPGPGGRRLRSLLEGPEPPCLSPGPGLPGFVVEELVLFRSHLESGGARYTPLSVFPIRGRVDP